ncbi:MAG: outer membrane protein assembly factor BamD [Planctomycetes bacterium]|nr:outer membrane protein assembly factor BamD [Planctomycetota bacterium]
MLSDGTMRVCLPVLAVLMACGNCLVCAGTLHLKDGKEWQDVSNSPEGRRLMAVAKFKQLISSGDAESATEELTRLKEAYPEIAGPAFNVFLEAETLYANGKWTKAVRKYDEVLNKWSESWLRQTILERKFSIGQAFLNGQKRRVMMVLNLSAFDEGEKIMYDIENRAGEAPIAKRALIAIARGYERRGQFADAYFVWEEINSRWTTGQLGTTAILEMANDQYSSYRGQDYDHTGLNKAKDHYQDIRIHYPQLAAEYEIDERLKDIDGLLAYKQYSIGEYYDRTGSRQAAKLYYEEVLDKWPDTAAAEMAQARMLAWNSGLTEIKPGEKNKVGRRLFDAGNTIVDSWFGLRFLGVKSR